jgi:cysteine desulfurase/selenocysteine lyase
MPADSLQLQERIVGWDRKVPLLNGRMVPYINFDNAASTPPLKVSLEAVNSLMGWYSSIHRGAGFKSQLASYIYDSTRDVVSDFVGADPERDAIIFVSGTTDAINRLAFNCTLGPGERIAISGMEHHANDLPWRRFCSPVRVPVSNEGIIDPDEVRKVLIEHGGKVKLFAVTGASNVIGTLVPIHDLAKICHQYGAKIMVDAAQLVPHCAVDMKPHDDPAHIDFLAFSAHKMYAPFGSGVLVAPKEMLNQGDPAVWGGGAVATVAEDQVVWLESPERNEAGSPNVAGVVAMAAAMKELQRIGYGTLQKVEESLTRRFLEYASRRPEITVYGITDLQRLHQRLGVISLNIEGVSHALAAAVLSYEGGIGVRNGCFCAHIYLLQLLKVPDNEQRTIRTRLGIGQHSDIPGAIRVSFGLYNTMEEVERLTSVLDMIIEHGWKGDYRDDPRDGSFHPASGKPNFGKYYGW